MLSESENCPNSFHPHHLEKNVVPFVPDFTILTISFSLKNLTSILENSLLYRQEEEKKTICWKIGYLLFFFKL
jgi:hypothetical protein